MTELMLEGNGRIRLDGSFPTTSITSQKLLGIYNFRVIKTKNYHSETVKEALKGILGVSIILAYPPWISPLGKILTNHFLKQ